MHVIALITLLTALLFFSLFICSFIHNYFPPPLPFSFRVSQLLLLLSFTFSFVVTRKRVTQNFPTCHFVVYLIFSFHFLSLFLLFITHHRCYGPSSGPEDGLEIPIV